jgi:hypothetical protein
MNLNFLYTLNGITRAVQKSYLTHGVRVRVNLFLFTATKSELT